MRLKQLMMVKLPNTDLEHLARQWTCVVRNWTFSPWNTKGVSPGLLFPCQLHKPRGPGASGTHISAHPMRPNAYVVRVPLFSEYYEENNPAKSIMYSYILMYFNNYSVTLERASDYSFPSRRKNKKKPNYWKKITKNLQQKNYKEWKLFTWNKRTPLKILRDKSGQKVLLNTCVFDMYNSRDASGNNNLFLVSVGAHISIVMYKWRSKTRTVVFGLQVVLTVNFLTIFWCQSRIV